MNEIKFEPGDVVQLKSGGPSMTVKGVGRYGMTATGENALCVWFEGKTLKEAVFELNTLTVDLEKFVSNR